MKRLSILAVAVSSLWLANAQTTPVIQVTLLGTGVPLLNVGALAANGRALSGLLVQAGTEKMLFDCGQGVYSRLIQSGGSALFPNLAVDKVFISHLHSDHIGDLGPLFVLGALYRYIDPVNDAEADLPLRVWGPGGSANQPTPTWAMMNAFRVAYDTDIYVRQLFTNPNDYAFNLNAVDTINSVAELWSGVVYQNNGVKVTAFQVDHDPVTPAYGFRVDYQGRSFVYSGDTTFSQNLVNAATGVDLLVNEVYGYPSAIAPEIYAYHTTPEANAAVFNTAKPKNVVYTHLVIPPGTTANDLVTRTRAAGYQGPLTAGVDLMQIAVNSDGSVKITPPANADEMNNQVATSDFIEVHQSIQRRARQNRK
jgi:ribonuclease Z